MADAYDELFVVISDPVFVDLEVAAAELMGELEELLPDCTCGGRPSVYSEPLSFRGGQVTPERWVIFHDCEPGRRTQSGWHLLPLHAVLYWMNGVIPGKHPHRAMFHPNFKPAMMSLTRWVRNALAGRPRIEVFGKDGGGDE